MNRRTFIPLLAFAALAACNTDKITGTPVSNGVVRVVREDNSLRITNLTAEGRGYIAADLNWLALADLSLLAFCNTTDSGCLRLPANGTITVPLSEVGGYSVGIKEIAVYTWRVLPSGTGGALEAVLDETVLLKL
jgi:predicted small secreted protein